MTTSQAADALHCPACGAPAASDASRCEYCGSTLATVACPSCFGRVMVGAKFCPHCGASIAPAELAKGEKYLCPRCRAEMKAIVIGGSNMQECPQCEGVWLGADALQQICADREKQAAVLGMPVPAAEPAGPEKPIRYLPCPICRKLMNRVNFAGCSHVILDVCKPHGTWFDKDELRRTIEFIRAGGLEKARAIQIAQMEDERRRLEAIKNASTLFDCEPSSGTNRYAQGTLLENLLSFLRD